MDVLFLGLLVVGAVLIVAGAVTARRREVEHHRARLAAVERKLDAVLDHLGIDRERPELRTVEELLAQGKTVAAVKAYRDATGAGLVEAKTAVDRLAERS